MRRSLFAEFVRALVLGRWCACRSRSPMHRGEADAGGAAGRAAARVQAGPARAAGDGREAGQGDLGVGTP